MPMKGDLVRNLISQLAFIRKHSLKVSSKEDDLLCGSACAFKNALAKGYLFFAGNLEMAPPFEYARHCRVHRCTIWISASLTLCGTLHGSLKLAASQLSSFSFHPKGQSCSSLWGLCFVSIFGGCMCFCFALIAQFPIGDSTALFKMLVIFKELF